MAILILIQIGVNRYKSKCIILRYVGKQNVYYNNIN